MAFTETDLEVICRAIATGELSVTFADRTVTYRSMTDLLLAKEIIEGEIAAAAGRSKQTLGYAVKGFDE